MLFAVKKEDRQAKREVGRKTYRNGPKNKWYDMEIELQLLKLHLLLQIAIDALAAVRLPIGGSKKRSC
jgi:hypothetical protein